jgi:hypothetical protein
VWAIDAASGPRLRLSGLVAVGILYAVDHEYNDGRYSSVIQQAIAAIIPRWEV